MMSAIELLEQLGASAKYNKNNSAEAQMMRDKVLQAMDNLEETPDKQWCVLVPAEEEEPKEEPGEDDDSEGKEETSIRFN
jgi:hypothetical protein